MALAACVLATFYGSSWFCTLAWYRSWVVDMGVNSASNRTQIERVIARVKKK